MDDVAIISIANSTTSTVIDEEDITSTYHAKINPNVACSLFANHWVNGKIETDLCSVKMNYVAGLKQKLSPTVFDQIATRDSMGKDEIITISSRSSKRSRSPLKSNESRKSADCLIKLENKTQDENQNNLNTERGQFIKQSKSSTPSGRKIILIDDPRVLAHKSKQNAKAATTITGRRVSSASSSGTSNFEANRLAATSSNQTSTGERMHGPNKLKCNASNDNAKHSLRKSSSHRTEPYSYQDTSSSNQNRSSSQRHVSATHSRGSSTHSHGSSSNRRESSSNRRESSSNRRELSSNRRESSPNRRESSSNRRESSSNRPESSSKRSKRSSSSERLSQGKESKKRHSSKDSHHSYLDRKGRLSDNKTKSMQCSKTAGNLPSSSSKMMHSSSAAPLQEVNIFETESNTNKKNHRQNLTKPIASTQKTYESEQSQNYDRKNKSPEVPELDDCVVNDMNPKVILNRLKINTLKRDASENERETESTLLSTTNNSEAPDIELQTEQFISESGTEDATIEIATSVSVEPIAVSMTQNSASKDVELQTEVFASDSGTEDVTEEVYVELILLSMSPNSAPQAEEFTNDSGILDATNEVSANVVSMTQNCASKDVESQTEVFTSDFSAQMDDEEPNQSILLLQEKVEEYKAILEEREQEIATCNRKIIEQQNVINERQRVIDERNKWVEERDLKIRESNQKVIDYENKIIKQKHKVFESITALEKIRKVNVNLVELLAKREKICFENHRDKPKSKKSKTPPLSTANNELTTAQNVPATANSENNGIRGSNIQSTVFTNSTTQIDSPSIQTSIGISAAQRMNHTPPTTPPATQSNGRNNTPQQSLPLQPQMTMSVGGTTNTSVPINHLQLIQNVEHNVMRSYQHAALNPAVDLQPLVNQPAINQPINIQPPINPALINQHLINQLSYSQSIINQPSVNQQMSFCCLGCHKTATSICKTCRNFTSCRECFNYIFARHKSECKLPKMVLISNLK